LYSYTIIIQPKCVHIGHLSLSYRALLWCHSPYDDVSEPFGWAFISWYK